MSKKFTELQIKKWKEVFNIIDVLFQNQDLEIYIEKQNIIEAWLIGDSIRDLYILQNPQVENYTFYLQVKDKNKIFDWVKKINEKNINTYLVPQNELIDPNIIYQSLSISLLNYGIDKEINIITGNLPPQEFVEKHMPINLNMIGLNISEVFSYQYMDTYMDDIIFLEDSRETMTPQDKEFSLFLKNDLSKCIWTNEQFDKGYQNKTLFILKHKWMTTTNGMEFLEQYLQKTYIKLESWLINH